MFERPLIESETGAQRWRTLLFSGLVHLGAISLLIILPLIYYQKIPVRFSSSEILTYMLEPTPPPPPPPAPRRSSQMEKAPKTVRLPELVAPSSIPDTIPPPPAEEDVPTVLDPWEPSPGPFSEAGSQSSSIGAPQGVVSSSPGSPAPPPAPAERKEPLRVSNGAIMSRLVHRVDPEYPPLAIRTRVEGIVVLQILVNEKGQVQEVEVVRGHQLLRESAVKAVRQWKYTPTLLNGIPVPVRATITVRFTLSR